MRPTAHIYAVLDAEFFGKSPRYLLCVGQSQSGGWQRVMDHKNKTNHSVVVHIDELYQVWRSGLELWGEDLDKDSDRSANVLAKAEKFFADIGAETVSDIVSAIDSSQPCSRR